MKSASPPARLDAPAVRSAYRGIAPIYDIWGRLTESKAQDICAGWISRETDPVVIDVATGTGTLLERVLRSMPGAIAIGLDLTDAMIDRAKTRTERFGERCLLAQADAHGLPLPDRCADVLSNNYMFDLLPESDFAPILSEFVRVLKPGGKLALINMTRPVSAIEKFWETLYRIHPPLLGGCRGVSMELHVVAAGFDVLACERVSQFAFPSELILARAPRGGEEAPRAGLETGL